MGKKKPIGFTPPADAPATEPVVLAPAAVTAADACLVSRETETRGQFEYCTLREFHEGEHVYGPAHMPELWEPGAELVERVEAMAFSGGGAPIDLDADTVKVMLEPSSITQPPASLTLQAAMESVGLATPAETLSLSLDDARRTGELPTIQFAAGRFYALTARALRHEQAALLKLSKSADDAGYPIEARAIRHDALAIGAEILPAFEAQAELPLATDEEVASAIINELRGFVHFHVKPATDTFDHEAVFLKGLGERLSAFAVSLTDAGYYAGNVARENEPEVLVLRNLKKLRA